MTPSSWHIGNWARGLALLLLALALAPLHAHAALVPLVAEAVELESEVEATKIEKQEHDAALDSLFAEFKTNADEARAILKENASDYSVQNRTKLSQIRARLARDRDLADALATRGSLDTRILQARIDALGPPPAEGASEPAFMTERREELTKRLGTIQQPILRLRDAQVTAAVLVSELDETISDLTQRRLFQGGQSPIDPRLWVGSAKDVTSGITKAAAAANKAVAEHGAGYVTLGVLLVLGIVVGLPLFGVFARRFITRFVEKRLLSAGGVARRLVLTILLDSLLALVLGISLFLATLVLLAALIPLIGAESIGELAASFILAGIIIAIGHWLGRGVLMSPFPELRLITLPEEGARRALLIVRRIAYVLAAELVVANLEEYNLLGPDLSRLLSAMLVTLGAWLLWQLANSILEARRFWESRVGKSATDTQPDATLDFATPMARAIKVFALAAFIAALIGFALLARYIFAALLLSLGTICTAIYVHRSFALFVTSLTTGRLHRYRRVLHFLPLLSGIAATLLVIPVLAVIWGYSVYEIGDTLLALRNGVNFGEIRISAGDVFTFFIVFFIGFFVTRWLQRFLKVSIMPEFGMDAGAEAAIITFLGYIGITLAAVVAIATTGLDLSSLAFVAGALSIGLGFGLQSVVENFTSGILLLVERPIKVGDWIEVGEHSGIVRKIAVRSTHVETFDRHQIIIPNSQLITEVVKNRSFSAAPTRIVVPVGVAYGTDLENARSILLEIAQSNGKVLETPEPAVAIEGFGDSSINMKILAFVREATDGAPTASEIYFAIASRFAAEGIEIPFPQRDLHVRTLPDELIAKPGPA